MSARVSYDAVIVGGGFFGCSLGVHLARNLGQRVVVLEREAALLQRASFANQARVHNGYHYPRSLLTALRCRVNFPLFLRDYRECVVSDFEKYYAVGRHSSKVTAEQFRLLCERVGAPTHPPKPVPPPTASSSARPRRPGRACSTTPLAAGSRRSTAPPRLRRSRACLSRVAT